MKSPLLSIQSLCVDFSSSPALHDISATIHHGEIVAVVGESGSGKTVLAHSILRLLTHGRTTGRLLFYGNGSPTAVDILTLSSKALNALRGRHIAMIFQEPMSAFNPILSIGTQMMEGMRHHLRLSRRAAYAQSLSLLEKVQLSNPADFMRLYPHQLSGGQRQRVMIAMALSCNPSLLIADEPTTALDPRIQMEIIALLQSLQKEFSLSILFITHDISLVAHFAHRVLVMNRSVLVEEGDNPAIFQSPSMDYTRTLIAQTPTLSYTPLPPLPDSEPLLRVESLCVSHGRHRTVDSVSLTIHPCETFALVGESGAGKTSIAKALLGLHPPVSGRIIFDGVDIMQLSESARRPLRPMMQMVFQDPYSSINPHHCVGDCVLEPLLVSPSHRHLPRRLMVCLAKDALERVGLPDAFDAYPHEFSGGQRQRICIARALIARPKLVIADEPLSALDVSTRQQILDLMHSLQEEYKLAWLIISHDLAIVSRIAHRVLVLKQGRMVAMGKTHTVFKTPDPYTKSLLDATPSFDFSPSSALVSS